MSKSIILINSFKPHRYKLALFVVVALVIFGLCVRVGGIKYNQPLENPGKPVFLNDRARDIIGSTPLTVPGFVTVPGLTGTGQIVAIADSGLDTGKLSDLHPDLQSTPGQMPKVVMLKSWSGSDSAADTVGHGTHMAATIAGTGASSGGKFRGVAPGASLYFQAIMNANGELAPPGDLKELFEPAYSAGARIHVDGWGIKQNSYTYNSQQIDDFIRSHRDFLVINGAGNDGPQWGTLTAEANSKNALTVGASVSPRPAFYPGSFWAGQTADLSSRGPTPDGRIKPEITAPGTSVISAKSSLVEGNLPGFPDYTRMDGTSMASAVAGGAVALLREFLSKETVYFAPSAALIKALLINGARAPEKGPSNEGFGSLDLSTTIISIKEETDKAIDNIIGLGQEEEMSYEYIVTSGDVPFKATLAWTDPAGEVSAGKVLVNDLDLKVIAPDGVIFLGNDFLHSGKPDNTNNIEQVFIPEPVAGKYKVIVTAKEIRKNAITRSLKPVQDYALVFGQNVYKTTIKNANWPRITLSDDRMLSSSLAGARVVVNDSLFHADSDHVFTGSDIYLAPKSKYIVSRLWRAKGVIVKPTSGGDLFLEGNPLLREGGYIAQTDKALPATVNGKSLLKESNLPTAMEISASINPSTQLIKKVDGRYEEREGFVKSIENGPQGDKQKLTLFKDEKIYPISPYAFYTFKDEIIDGDVKQLPFGTGELTDLENIIPGMSVKLTVSPSNGEVQSIAVKRQIAVGTIKEVNVTGSEIKLESGEVYHYISNALVKKDKVTAGFKDLNEGDIVTALLLPGSKDIMGIVAYSKVCYGKVIGFNSKQNILLLASQSGETEIFNITGDLQVFRWGLLTDINAIATGNWVRLTINPKNSEPWRLDIAETLEERGKIFKAYDKANGIIVSGDGSVYQISSLSAYSKNSFPVNAVDLLPGEQMDVASLLMPEAGSKALISINARNNKIRPELSASAILVSAEKYYLAGVTTGKKLWLWHEDGSSESITVDAGGLFSCYNQKLSENADVLVAVDEETGAVAGQRIVFPVKNAGYPNDIYNHWANDEIRVLVERGIVSCYPDGSFRPDESITRIELIKILSDSLGWRSEQDAMYLLPFNDESTIPNWGMPELVEMTRKGVIKGYPDGYLYPFAKTSRAEVAVIVARALNFIKPFPVKESKTFEFKDVPSWAKEAVAGLSAAKIISGNSPDFFQPDDFTTRAEVAVIINRLMNYYKDQQIN